MVRTVPCGDNPKPTNKCKRLQSECIRVAAISMSPERGREIMRILILLAFCLFAAGCGSVKDTQWNKAVEKCKPFGGVRMYVLSVNWGSDLAVCQDGTRIFIEAASG